LRDSKTSGRSHFLLGLSPFALGTDLSLCFAILSMSLELWKYVHVDWSMPSWEVVQSLRIASISCRQAVNKFRRNFDMLHAQTLSEI